MPTPPATARIHGLDTLRALAIVLVFMSHYASFVSGEPTFGFLGEVGWSGVDLFFALSGYLIGNQILAALRGPEKLSLGRFYARRLLRTLPNFYVVLALYACWPYVRGDSVMPELWRFLTFTQNLGLNPGTAFSHAWSLCVEEQFYMLLPALALFVAARRRALPLAWLLVLGSLLAGMLIRSYVWHNYVDGSEPNIYRYYNLVYYSTLCRFDELVAGVALALVKNHHPQIWQRLTACGNAMLAAGATLLGLAWYLFLQERYGYAMTVFGYPLLALAISLLLLAALSPGALLYRLRVPGAAALALWSYAIYLSHKQLCVLLGKVLAEQGLAPTGWPAVALLSLASVAAGWLLYSVVERPFMALRQRWVPHHFVRAQGGGRQAPTNAAVSDLGATS